MQIWLWKTSLLEFVGQWLRNRHWWSQREVVIAVDSSSCEGGSSEPNTFIVFQDLARGVLSKISIVYRIWKQSNLHARDEHH